ncbi:MAG: 8-amino-7-oxononanoate synthase [Planctomycetota bacterium]
MDRANRLRQLRVVSPQGRYIEIDGRRLLNLASNDYLGLSQHPKLIEAAINTTRDLGVGSGASRLISGTQPIHRELEQRFAAFKHAEAALLMPTGYTANLAVLSTLPQRGDLIVMDKLVHASLIDAARASEAEMRTFPHLDLERADQLIQRQSSGRRFIVTDSVFSMDGECADLPALCDLADRCDASLIVDEAHATGLLGNDGSGLASAQGVAERVYHCGAGGVVISTASKALGSLGGLITAERSVIDLIINKARPFIYSTAVPSAQAAAINAALDVIRDEPALREHLAALSAHLGNELTNTGWPALVTDLPTPILPLLVGDEHAALSLQTALFEAGIFAPAIRPPTVAPGQCRVRLSLRADLHVHDLNAILEAVQPRCSE